MDYNTLDTLLRKHTKAEEQNLLAGITTADYSMLDTEITHGIPVPILTKKEVAEFSPNQTFVICKHPRFTHVPKHMHEWIEMTYIYAGSCSQQIDENLYNLSKGQLSLIDTRTPHKIQASRENDILINLLFDRDYFSAKFLSRFSSQSIISNFIINAISEKTSKDNYILFHAQQNRHLHVLMKEIMCEYFSPSLNSADMLDACLVQIFLELIRTKEHELSETSAFKKGVSLLSVLQYMEQNYKDATLTAAARHFSLNPSYLSTLLKEKLGFTYGELLHKTKITHAKRLLSCTALCITDVAHSVGYENISFFYRIFQEEAGCTPGDYRKNIPKAELQNLSNLF